MSSEASNILADIVAEFETFATPLAEALSHSGGVYELLAMRGWNLTGLKSADLSAFAALVDTLQTSLADVKKIESFEDLQGIATAMGDLGAALGQIDNIRQTLTGLASVQLTGPQAEALAGDVMECLVLAYLQRRLPRTHAVLIGLTLIEFESAETLIDAAGAILRYPIRRPTLRFDALGKLLTDPVAHLKAAYLPSAGLANEPATLEFAARLFSRLEAIIQSLGGRAVAGLQDPLGSELLNPPNPAFARSLTLIFTPPAIPIGNSGAALSSQFGSTLVVVPGDGQASDNTNGPALEFVPFGLASVGAQFGGWTVGLTASGAASPLVITGQGVHFADLTASRFGLKFDLSKGVEGAPAVLIGSAKGTRLQIDTITFSTSIELAPNERDYGFLLDLHKAALIIAAGDGDGFLQKVLPKDGIRTDFDLAVGWSNTRGLYFRGAIGLEAELPLGIDLFGILKIDSVFVSVRAKAGQGPPALGTALAVTTTLKLGPFTAIVERLGAQANFTFPLGGGNLGPAEFGLGFKPPSGIGMSLKSGPVKGGGYLFIDPDAGQYAGILQLEFSQIAIKAIGLLNTKMPDGSQGFSLLIIITVEFSPIQLGYGFTLNGVGGLIGVNRDMLLEPLRAGVKNRTLDSILFPTDPVANAKRIIGDLKAVFPPAQGRFAFGLMAKLGWGASIVTAELGIIIVLLEPVRLAIIGKIALVLPEDNEEAIVRLKLDVLGSIDFSKGDLGIDASIYDSRIAIFNIEGDMALRVNWGASPFFAFAVGGFHPQFPVPPGFPSLRRLSLSLATSDNPLIRLETYLALTANSVQIGAKIEIHAEFSLLGTWSVDAFMGFDALIYFSPFHFTLDVYGGAALKYNAKPFLALDLLLSVSGPGLWVVRGHATFDFFGHHSVEIDRTFGNPEPTTPQALADPLAELKVALEEIRNWSAQLPDGGDMLVSLRQIDAPDLVLMHPLGRMTVTERVLPLGVGITHFGAAQIGETRSVDIGSIRIGSQTAAVAAQNVSGATSLREKFAPGQFFDLTEEQKIAGPEFEALPSGLAGIGSNQTAWGTAESATFDYETLVIDALQAQPSRIADHYRPREQIALSLARASAAGRAPARNQGRAAFKGSSQGIEVREPKYSVVSTDEMARAPGTGQFASRTEARLAMEQRATDDDLQIVGAHEEVA
jgi:hypothetical protein